MTWPGLATLYPWIALCGGIGGVVVGAATGDHFASQLRADGEVWLGAVAGLSVVGGAYFVGVVLLVVGAVVREVVTSAGMSFGESAASLPGGLVLAFVGGIPYLLVAVATGGGVGHVLRLQLRHRAQAS